MSRGDGIGPGRVLRQELVDKGHSRSSHRTYAAVTVAKVGLQRAVGDEGTGHRFLALQCPSRLYICSL